MPSPLAGHAVNPSVEAPRRHPCRRGSRNRQGHRTRELVGCFPQSLFLGLRWEDETFVSRVLKACRLLGLRRELIGRKVIRTTRITHCS